MLSTDPLRPPYELGIAHARRAARTWLVLVLMVVAGAASAALSGIMLGVPGMSGPMIEAPVADGPWAFEWSGNAQAPVAQQQEQVRALRLVVGGAAALLTVICLLTISGLWRQRLLLRRNEYFVHWAVGARRLQLAARLIGEARAWATGAIGLTLLATAIVAGVIDGAFPGAAPLTPNMAASAILLTGLAVVLIRWESRAGAESHEAARSRSWELLGSPPMIGAVGFAALTGVGLLAVHAPRASGRTAEARGTMVAASLSAVPMSSRGEEILGWTERARAAGAPVGFASAGASRATGRVDYATVECGRCFESLMPAPLKIVRAEVHAVAPDTFVHLGIAVARGRDFDDDIDRGSPNVAIVSRALAGRHFERGEPLGRRLRVGESDWLTVVGVVEDRSDVLSHQDYAIYVPLAQAAPADIEVFVDGPGSSLEPILADAPVGVVLGSPRSRREVFSTHRWFRSLLNALGIAALALLGAGLWVSAANEAGAARYEVTVRRAVGATRRSMWRFYLSFAARRLCFALTVGAWLSLFLGAGLKAAYASVPQIDWLVWAGAAGWVCAMYVMGSFRSIMRAAVEPFLSTLNAAS